MEKNYFQQLPPLVEKSLNHDFVFIVTKDLVQHFPARQWTDQEILDNIQQRFSDEGHFISMENYRLVVLPNRPDVKIIVP